MDYFTEEELDTMGEILALYEHSNDLSSLEYNQLRTIMEKLDGLREL